MSSSLTLGAFNLTDPTGATYQTRTLASGTSRGNPVPLETAVKTWLQDGSIVVTQGYDNREVHVVVRLMANNLTNIALAEAALNAELGKPNTLTWTPANGPASVFTVVTSSLQVVDDDGDQGEEQPIAWRTYNIRLLCEAFVRSATEVTTTALGSGTMTSIPSPVSATIDDGTLTTGWAGTYSQTAIDHTTPTSSGSTTVSTTGGVLASLTPSTAAHFYSAIDLKKTVTVDVSVTKQIVVTWQWDAAGGPYIDNFVSQDLKLLVNESTTPVYLTRVSGTVSPARATFTEAIFQVPSSMTSITSLRLTVFLFGPGSAGTQEVLKFDSIVRNNASSSVSTPRQLQRTIDVTGSARTQGRVTISHETSALGDTLAYFWPDVGSNYSPPLRQFRTSGGGVTADTTLVSGARENLVGSTTVFTVPATRVPAGNYLLMARLGGAATTATVTWTATTILNSVDIGPTVTGSRAITLTTAYQNFVIDRAVLPTRDVNQSSTTASVKITLTATVGTGSTALLDEAWIFNNTIGQLTAVGCGTAAPSSGGSSNRVFIKPATATSPRPTIRLGFASDESDSAYPITLTAWQPPQFTPARVNVFTVTSNALDAAVTLFHFPRWHTNAAS